MLGLIFPLVFLAHGPIGIFTSGIVCLIALYRFVLNRKTTLEPIILTNLCLSLAVFFQIFIGPHEETPNPISILRVFFAVNLITLYFIIWSQKRIKWQLENINVLLLLILLALTLVINLPSFGVAHTRFVSFSSSDGEGGSHLLGFSMALLFAMILFSNTFAPYLKFVLLFSVFMIGIGTGSRTFLLGAASTLGFLTWQHTKLGFFGLLLIGSLIANHLVANLRIFAAGSDYLRFEKLVTGLNGFDSSFSLFFGYGIIGRDMFWYDNTYLSLVIDSGFLGLLPLFLVGISVFIKNIKTQQSNFLFILPLALCLVNDYGYSLTGMACSILFAAMQPARSERSVD